MTGKGRAFVQEQILVPAHALVFNKELLALDSTEMLTIRQALEPRFDYDELTNR